MAFIDLCGGIEIIEENNHHRNNLNSPDLISILDKLGLFIRNVVGKINIERNMVGINNLSNREYWLEKTLANIPEGKTILDAGAGELQYKKYCSHLKYTSQDFGIYNGSGDTKGLQTSNWDNSKLDITSDIAKIPLPKNSFDSIMCVEVLEHIPNPDIAIKEMTRLLKPGGKLIITAPFNSLTHFSPYFFSTGFSENYYNYWLDFYNLDIEEITKNGNYFEYIAQELRRLPKINEKYSGTKFTKKEKKSVKSLLKFIKNASKLDSGSSELLCFGLQIIAIKRI